MMYNPQLETFICVVDSGSFSKAAEKLYITAPAVIKQINSLESSLDLHLFERTHRGLIVTEAGKSLYQDAKYLIQYCKDSVSRARNAQNDQECASAYEDHTGGMELQYPIRPVVLHGTLRKSKEAVIRCRKSDCGGRNALNRNI